LRLVEAYGRVAGMALWKRVAIGVDGKRTVSSQSSLLLSILVLPTLLRIHHIVGKGPNRSRSVLLHSRRNRRKGLQRVEEERSGAQKIVVIVS